tara:strand:+ start:241 stop:453 length:213 start_codon:yes stop_codon:yes gene_type:complete
MKTHELPGGTMILLSNLENKVYECMREEVCKEDMSERDAYVAQQLVNKGMCARTQREGKTYYKQAPRSFE